MHTQIKQVNILGYQTKHLKQIEALFEEHPGEHFTAEQVLMMFRKQGKVIGLSTCYRNMEKLVSSGMITKYETGGKSCFSLCNKNDKEHYHLRCTNCGSLLHTDCDYLDALSEHIKKDHGFVLNKQRSVLYGICKECRNKE